MEIALTASNRRALLVYDEAEVFLQEFTQANSKGNNV